MTKLDKPQTSSSCEADNTFAFLLLSDVYFNNNLLHYTTDLNYTKTCVSLLMKILYIMFGFFFFYSSF